MKKILLLAACGMLAAGANAQYQVNPSNDSVVSKGVSVIYDMILSDEARAAFKNSGAEEVYIGPEGDGSDENAIRPLYIWENTLVGGDSSNPGVDMAEGSYLSFEVGSVGWSGAGICANQPIDISKINDNTRFHIAYMTPTGNAPASLAFILLDNPAMKCNPGKFAVGSNFVDGANTYVSVGAKATDDWQGVDISISDVKKLWPSFSFDTDSLKCFTSNVFEFLGGGVQGTTFAMDAIYFYNLKGGTEGVKGVQAEAADFKITRNTVNVLGAEGIQLYNLAGQLVKATEGTTLGLNNLAKGVYIAKCRNKAVKVIVE